MLKKVFVYTLSSFLSLTFCSCKRNVYDLVVAYKEDNSNNVGFVANELSNAISYYFNLKILTVDVDSLGATKPDFILQISDDNCSNFSIVTDNDRVLLNSDSTYGLIEAGRNVLYNLLVYDFNEAMEYYKNEYNSSYVMPKTISVMSFNLCLVDNEYLANADDGKVVSRIPRAAKCINNWEPDSIGFQEMNDKWFNGLNESLSTIYDYTGLVSENGDSGERTSIFFKKNELTLLEEGTKWFSDSPDIPSHLDNYDGHNRIFTYAVFKRNIDGFVYMHVNTHLGLKKDNRIDSVKMLDDFLETYKNRYPIFVTGDFNCVSGDNDAIDYLLFEKGYSDARKEAIEVYSHYTFPQVGYYPKDAKDKIVVDYCLKVNPGLMFFKYAVDTNKYSGDGIEKPQLTSDHYPVFLEVLPYTPLIEYEKGK